jgi:hypothetical protein
MSVAEVEAIVHGPSMAANLAGRTAGQAGPILALLTSLHVLAKPYLRLGTVGFACLPAAAFAWAGVPLGLLVLGVTLIALEKAAHP